MIRAWALALVLSAGCATLPRLEVGRAYLVVWAYTHVNGEPSAYREVIIIDQIGRDGWIYGRNPDNPRVWAFQLRNALAMTPMPSHPAPVVEQYRSRK